MQRKAVKIGKKFMAFALAVALVFTSVNLPSLAVWAAVTNEFEATGTHGATYDAEKKQVTFFVNSDDACYANISSMWYKEYSSYEKAAAAHISNAGNFIVDVGATSLTENGEQTQKSVTVDVTEGTGAILYYINGGANHARTDYEHIIVIDENAGSGVDSTESVDGTETVGSTESGDSTSIEITSLEYYDDNNKSPVSYDSQNKVFSFCYPKINGEAISQDGMEEAEKAFEILIKSGDEWLNIDDMSVTWSKEYWTWDGGGAWGIMFSLNQTSEIRFRSVANPDVYLDYTLEWPKEVSKLAFNQESIEVNGTGVAVNFDYLIVNDGEYTGGDIVDQLTWLIKTEDTSGFVSIDKVYTWDTDWGWDSAPAKGGYWFDPVQKSFTLRAVLTADTSIYADINIIYDNTVDEKGPEYDFSDEEYNSKNDFADPGTVKDGYELIWADEFDGDYGSDSVDENTGLNLDKWAYQLGDGSTDCGNAGWGNNELQAYTSDEKNIAVNEDLDDDGSPDGLLRITASYEADGYTYAEESSKKYTSARIRTTDGTDALFSTTYGYIEARMSLPATKGAWPAFWMLPQSTEIYGAWPVSGEIDIMETCGAFENGTHNSTCSTLHYGAPDHVYRGSGYTELSSDYTSFHTYAVDWEPGKMTFYYDGVKIYEKANWTSGKEGASDTLSFDAPFDQPFYAILNLAVDSGSFGGSTNKATFQDDINMYVDYVRAYQRTDGYADSALRGESGGYEDDWAAYAGQNQIAEIAEDNLSSDEVVGTLENAGTVDAGKWYLATTEGGTATLNAYKDTDGTDWANVGIIAKGSQDYSVQLIGHYDAKAGYVYKVSFDAYATGNMVGQKVNCDSKEWKGWGTYGITSFTLGSEAQSYSFLVDQEEAFDDCRIEFNLGARESGNVFISNVKVEIVDPTSLNQEGVHTALADGNIIYNGTFDQGVDHVGYWRASEGTTLTVPRYTKEDLTGKDVSVEDVASTLNSYEKLTDGVKYYERRAQITSQTGVAAEIYQTDLTMPADSYTLSFDLYSKADTSVTAAIYRVNVTDDGKTLGDKILSTTTSYTAGSGVKPYKWSFKTTEDVENAALVLTFADGASVWLDNVKLLGESLGEEVDQNPIDSDTNWEAANGTITSAGVIDGVAKFTGITSGTVWYSPQIASDVFSMATGKEYEISFKYKLEGTTNNKVEYMIQENGGSWYIFNQGEGANSTGTVTVTYDEGQADGDGFCTYTHKFSTEKSLSNVHLLFGFGNSEASDATFSYKDVTLKVVGEAQTGGDVDPDPMPESYSITYVLDGGVNAASNPIGYTQGVGVASLADAKRTGGYKFLGWTLGAAGIDYITSIPSSSTGDVVLYANWEAPEKAATPVFTKQPADAVYEQGAATTALTIEASSTDELPLSYQWYSNAANSTTGGTAITGATEASYVPSAAAAGTTYYYCVVINTNSAATVTKVASATSSAAKVVVNEKQVNAVAPAITLQPANAVYTAGDAAKALTVAASVADGGSLSYQWYKNTSNAATGGTAITGATAASYTPATTVAGTTYYYCVVTNTNTAVTGIKTATATSAVAAVVVNAKSVPAVTYTVTFNSKGGTNVAAQTVTGGSTATKPADPTRKGYKFAGWYAGSTAYNFATPVKANTTLTAKWTQIKVSKIKITGISKQIAAGKKIKLTATVTPTTAKNRAVTWKTSNKKYATVTSKGVVTLKKAGIGKTVTITATAKDGSKKKATYKIKIMKNAVKKITLKASKTKVKAGKKVTVRATVSPTKNLNKKLTWKSSNTKYATVNSKGVVTTKKAGKGKTVTITASATDGSGKKKSIKIKITK